MTKNIYRVTCAFMRRHTPCFSSIRLYGRWMHRNPAKVMLPFESESKTTIKKEKIIDLSSDILKKLKNEPITSEENNDSKTSNMNEEKSQKVKENRETMLKKRKFYLSQKKVFNDTGEIIYEKLKEKDGRISSLLVKLKSKKERIRTGQMLVEGWRLIVDGLEAKCILKYVIFSRVEDLDHLRPFLPKTGVQFFKIPYKEIAMWSDVETSTGIFGVFEMPTPDNIKTFSRPLPLQFICDNVRTPGNLGAILRAAVGVGCEKVLLTKGCVDLWDSKVIRSAAGAHFRQPIYPSIDWEEMPKLLDTNTSLFIADSDTRTADEGTTEDKMLHKLVPIVPYYSVDFGNIKHVTLVIGGETEGISEDSYRFATTRNGLRLHIPLQRGVESLNTGMAAAVIAFEIRKQFIQAWTKAKLEAQDIKVT
ncbi:rRNA methyltransferase 3, mitochondrial [Maniola hyperantus]|uniref:rRNA methyltransferase 3, mitochondrial n=1 Tax=Aphantopus hyperantus TaxID=2795564 RepID=UPI001569F9B9|nr:rRNA methyltransferase 3, mitochondrial [Maniola hyperantus]